jgi:ATP-dependent Lon protease
VRWYPSKHVPPTTAMTGEVCQRIVTSSLCSRSDMGVALLQITLRRRVSPVGRIKENVLGAHRAGANRVILPWANQKHVEYDVTNDVHARIQFVFARTVREVLNAAFGPGSLPWRAPDAHHPLVESSL